VVVESEEVVGRGDEPPSFAMAERVAEVHDQGVEILGQAASG
jgi:hypothetical protein